MFWSSAKDEFDLELSKAVGARQAGNEGRARVCARRAAGIAVRAYFARREIPAPGRSAYDLLVYLQAMPDMPVRVREAARQLAMRVNEDFALPAEADLIEEARQLARGLDAKLDELENS